jgi:hypothetical protein
MNSSPPSNSTRSRSSILIGVLLAPVLLAVGYTSGRAVRSSESESAPLQPPAAQHSARAAESPQILEELHALHEELRTLREELERVRSERTPAAPSSDESARLARRIEALEADRGSPRDRRGDVLAKLRTPEPDLFARLVREYDARPLHNPNDPNDDAYDQWMSEWERKVRDQLTLAHQLWHADDVLVAYGRPDKVETGRRLTYLLEQNANGRLELSFHIMNEWVVVVDTDLIDAAR